jgi:hypothetical protein
MLLETLATDPKWVPTFARIILGIIFFAHGAQKVLGWFGGPGLRKTLSNLTEHVGLPTVVAVAAIGAEFLGVGRSSWDFLPALAHSASSSTWSRQFSWCTGSLAFS